MAIESICTSPMGGPTSVAHEEGFVLLVRQSEELSQLVLFNPAGRALNPQGEKDDQWDFQDPKMEVLYRIRPYFGGISPYIALTWALYMVGTSILGSWNSH